MKPAKFTVGATALCALIALAVPASAQTQGAAGGGKTDNPMSMGINFDKAGPDAETQQKRREIEEAYKQATKSQQPQTSAVNDPWANMRGNEPPKAAAHPQAKTAQKKKPAQ
jgi:hypothetical protein